MNPNSAGVFSSISNPGKLLIIQTLSGFSLWIDIFLIFLIPSFVWGSTPLQIAIISAVLTIPSLILGPIMGAGDTAFFNFYFKHFVYHINDT